MVYVILIVGLIIGVPVAFAIVAALMYFMAVGEFPYNVRIVATQMFGGLQSYPLLAIPLFILAGELMNESGITSRIIAFTNVIVGRLRAGLALVNIWASVIFAGLSGSAVADTSAIGRVFIPEMEKRGYPRDFSAAITAASSVIGPIIPPSIPVIIYALIVTGVSVPGMFLGGVVPGILLAIFLSVYVMLFKGHYEKEAMEAEAASVSKRKILIQGIIPLLMPVFVVGTILFGIVTPTEAASFAVAYALIVGLFLFRELKWTDLPKIFANSMRDSAVIMIVMAAVAAAIGSQPGVARARGAREYGIAAGRARGAGAEVDECAIARSRHAASTAAVSVLGELRKTGCPFPGRRGVVEKGAVVRRRIAVGRQTDGKDRVARAGFAFNLAAVVVEATGCRRGGAVFCTELDVAAPAPLFPPGAVVEV